MSSLLGGIIGILLLIPFRKYFVSDMHGKYPFPEATATTQVLVSGEKGGNCREQEGDHANQQQANNRMEPVMQHPKLEEEEGND